MREHAFLRDMSGDPAFLSGLRALRALSADSGFDVVLTLPDGSMHRPSGACPTGQVIASSENCGFFRRADVLYAPECSGDCADETPEESTESAESTPDNAGDDLALLGRALDFLTRLERLSATFFATPRPEAGVEPGAGLAGNNSFSNSTGAPALRAV